MKEVIGWRLLRWIFGGFYLAIGLQSFLVVLGLIPRPDFDMQQGSAAFMTALRETGFIVPLMVIGFVASGVALLYQRTVPLGLVILAPFVVVIFFTNVMLDPRWAWGTVHLLVLLALAWRHRSAFTPLWSYDSRTDS